MSKRPGVVVHACYSSSGKVGPWDSLACQENSRLVEILSPNRWMGSEEPHWTLPSGLNYTHILVHLYIHDSLSEDHARTRGPYY